jgi:hypothetical protein
MSECLTCKHWQRDIYDGMIGICTTLSEWRFQHEEENQFCKYEFGEDRKPSKDYYRYKPVEERREQPVLQFDPKPMPYWKVKEIERRYGKDTA